MKMSGTSWSLDDLLKSRLSSAVIHGCSKISSDKIRSSGSLRSNERIIHLAFDVKQSGTRNWPREIFANNDACSESLNGYLEWKSKLVKTFAQEMLKILHEMHMVVLDDCSSSIFIDEYFQTEPNVTSVKLWDLIPSIRLKWVDIYEIAKSISLASFGMSVKIHSFRS